MALELDEETREVVVPDDFAEALAAVPHGPGVLRRPLLQPAPLVRAGHRGGEEARDARVRRIDKAVARLAEGRGQT